jgi:hypothetical protein
MFFCEACGLVCCSGSASVCEVHHLRLVLGSAVCCCAAAEVSCISEAGHDRQRQCALRVRLLRGSIDLQSSQSTSLDKRRGGLVL